MKKSFPLLLLTRPSDAFGDIAAGREGWAWPLALYAAGAALSAALASWLPPEYMQAAFEGLTPARHGFGFNLAVSLAGGMVFTLFTCALLAAFASFIKEGRLALRLAPPAAGVAAYGLLAAVFFRLGPPAPAGLAAAAPAAAFAAWAALRDRRAYAALLKAVLAVSAVEILSALASAAAALAGSTAAFSVLQYIFSFISLVWTVKALGALYGAGGARGTAAALLALLGSAAFAFLLFAAGLLRPELFQAALLM